LIDLKTNNRVRKLGQIWDSPKFAVYLFTPKEKMVGTAGLEPAASFSSSFDYNDLAKKSDKNRWDKSGTRL
jgi:hypothetical protein